MSCMLMWYVRIFTWCVRVHPNSNYTSAFVFINGWTATVLVHLFGECHFSVADPGGGGNGGNCPPPF